jgi:hypothetical protein
MLYFYFYVSEQISKVFSSDISAFVFTPKISSKLPHSLKFPEKHSVCFTPKLISTEMYMAMM